MKADTVDSSRTKARLAYAAAGVTCAFLIYLLVQQSLDVVVITILSFAGAFTSMAWEQKRATAADVVLTPAKLILASISGAAVSAALIYFILYLPLTQLDYWFGVTLGAGIPNGLAAAGIWELVSYARRQSLSAESHDGLGA